MTDFEISEDILVDATKSWLGITAFWTVGTEIHPKRVLGEIRIATVECL